ncbi:MAG: Sulfite reductase [NADPH] flavoprotein alpha-component [Chlamydiae bacterium]|nr:Sulfite reductase [NADPH] flavoprotein alpha-component [Chlamydiota bacterium]
MTVFERNNPAMATIEERYPLTGKGSSKSIYHVRLKLPVITPPFSVGDSIGILSQNDFGHVSSLLEALNYSGKEIVKDPRRQDSLPLHQYLLERVNLARLNPSLVRLAAIEMSATPEERKLFLNSQDPLIFLRNHSPAPLPLELLPACFGPLLPRFYSIASSPLLHPGAIDLTVAVLSYTIGEETRRGVANHFLCSQAKIGKTPIPFYVQPAHHFALPDEPNTKIIMVGPGTGVAPFRAFLQERIHLNSTGDHWLFFGERHEEHDFFYKDYWHSLVEKKKLRLSTAFSRASHEKFYVQHAMEAEGKELFRWLEEGGYFYVCGDAKQMARDVDATLHKLVALHGKLSAEEAKSYVKSLKAAGRYLTDVY